MPKAIFVGSVQKAIEDLLKKVVGPNLDTPPEKIKENLEMIYGQRFESVTITGPFGEPCTMLRPVSDKSKVSMN